MQVLDIQPGGSRRITVGPDRRAAGLIATLLTVHGALLLYAGHIGALTFNLKVYVILGAWVVADVLMLWLASTRTFRLGGEHLFISGPLGLGGATFDASEAKLRLTEVTSWGQPSYRLTWVLPDGRERVMCTWVADRYPLLEALRDGMAPGASPAQLAQLRTLAEREVNNQRQNLIRFAAVAVVSVLAASWLAVSPMV